MCMYVAMTTNIKTNGGSIKKEMELYNVCTCTCIHVCTCIVYIHDKMIYTRNHKL